jgi:NADH-quinone oxidoreductase subunit J
MVLFLFVVMMLDINIDTLREGFWRHFPLAGAIGAVIALEIGFVVLRGFKLSDAPAPDAALAQFGNTKVLGMELYSQYLYPLEIAAVVLLVAIIAAIALTMRRRKDSRYQNPSEQVKARKADRLRIVKIPAQQEAAPAAGAASTQKAGPV